MTLLLESPAFPDGGNIPPLYTCRGQNINPSFVISGIPDRCRSLVLIMDDPDAAKEPEGSGIAFDHWLLYNIDATTTRIDESSYPDEASMGLNSLGIDAYTGPCPPTFRHQYFFHLFALDSKLSFETPPTKVELQETLSAHVIDETTITGYFAPPI